MHVFNSNVGGVGTAVYTVWIECTLLRRILDVVLFCSLCLFSVHPLSLSLSYFYAWCSYAIRYYYECFCTGAMLTSIACVGCWKEKRRKKPNRCVRICVCIHTVHTFVYPCVWIVGARSFLRVNVYAFIVLLLAYFTSLLLVLVLLLAGWLCVVSMSLCVVFFADKNSKTEE